MLRPTFVFSPRTHARAWILHYFTCVALALVGQDALAQTNRDPERVRFVTTDLAHFWDAFDARGALGTGPALDSLYFGRASEGLHDFRRLRLEDRGQFARTVERAERYYASTRSSMARIPSFEPRLRDMLRRFDALYPDAVFPDVYFVVGRLSTGGTIGPAGLLIGAEMYGRTDDSLLAAPLNDWHRAVLRPVDDLAAIVFHELVHYQQGLSGNTLLARSLREGIADFVGELISGQNINLVPLAYLAANRDALRAEFLAEMNRNDVSRWMYQGAASSERPADLGYAVGYEIAKAFYERSADKPAAVHRMLRLASVRDARRFLEESGWAQP